MGDHIDGLESKTSELSERDFKMLLGEQYRISDTAFNWRRYLRNPARFERYVEKLRNKENRSYLDAGD